MDISALSYILVPVRDLDVMRRWYIEVLELPVRSDEPTAVEFAVGGLTLAFYPCPEAVDAGETEGLYFAFEVGDIEHEVKLLQERDVQFVDRGQGVIEQREGFRCADFHDPEGNLLGLTQAD